uniref:Uncharacterized protein n=1 Tax=Palpitomonas bilix TaxID=652834 RepID=A0A7S3G4F9_9EUKA|mmetsp:Transcript_18373/g.46066  ORF Transcript_18373/g.46066 Transcript_18373/m.46066 type:complete len:491 (+) Transcript_18373:157-1629(+)
MWSALIRRAQPKVVAFRTTTLFSHHSNVSYLFGSCTASYSTRVALSMEDRRKVAATRSCDVNCHDFEDEMNEEYEGEEALEKELDRDFQQFEGDAPAVAKKDQRSISVALVGAPNAGKSTLLNYLIGTKLSAVTHKAQTTRERVLGVMTEGKCQIVFMDTPGVVTSAGETKQYRALFATAKSSAQEADLVAFVVDAAKKGKAEGGLLYLDRAMEALANTQSKPLLVMNKMDLIPKDEGMSLAGELLLKRQFERIFLLSARSGKHVDNFKEYLQSKAVKREWMFEPERETDMPQSKRVLEIIREKLFLRIHDELPYTLKQTLDEFKELQSGDIRIHSTVYTEREKQRKMVVGKEGKTIDAIIKQSKKEIEALFGRPVELYINVRSKQGKTVRREAVAGQGVDLSMLQSELKSEKKGARPHASHAHRSDSSSASHRRDRHAHHRDTPDPSAAPTVDDAQSAVKDGSNNDGKKREMSADEFVSLLKKAKVGNQ